MAKQGSFENFIDELIQQVWVMPRDLTNLKYLHLRTQLTNYLLIWIEGEVERQSGGAPADGSRERAQEYLKDIVRRSGITLPVPSTVHQFIRCNSEPNKKAALPRKRRRLPRSERYGTYWHPIQQAP